MATIEQKKEEVKKRSFSVTVLILAVLGIPLAFLRAWCVFKIQNLFDLPFGLSIHQWIALSMILSMLQKVKVGSPVDDKSNLEIASAIISKAVVYLTMLGIAYAYFLIIN